MTNGDRGWSEYWEQEGAQGEVFVSLKGKRHPVLAEHWRDFFAGVAAESRVVDIASGAGSIFASLPEGHTLDLHALDISSSALEQLSNRLPGVTTVESSADSLPFDDRSFDIVVSQFGIEYAGVAAFAEAGRVVATGGRLVVLVHIRDGYIDSNNKAQLAEAILTKESGFIPRAIELTETAFGNDPARLAKDEQAFVPLIEVVGAAIARCRQGVHSYLLSGFQQLYENRIQYDLPDIVQWLEGMSGEVDRAIDRLTRIRNAALNEQDIESVRADLESLAFTDLEVGPYSAGHDRPLAWRINALRGE